MTGGVPYGWAIGVDDEACIASPIDPERMLCGRRRGFVPVVPPLNPGRVHPVCAGRWLLTPHRAVPDPRGCCPVCGGDVPLVDGRVDGHGMWVVDRHGMRSTEQGCAGEGLAPEPETQS